MKASAKTELLRGRIMLQTGINVSDHCAETLRRACVTLQRWFELECGNSDNNKSWHVERDEDTDKPFMVYQSHGYKTSSRVAIPDRERGARERVAKVCKEAGLHFYVQTDPRGCSLYVSAMPISDQKHLRAVPCCID